ncbi:hypothetical protein BGZ60DRAFT_417858 [Tricladium varicosporioides]|nr:hypothetical protein BGZ60DRAFT_417858 [Hymenoscyphus varicosporioides]
MGGAQGSSQVTVKRNDGTEATYPTRYELKVVSFEVVDENDDGINEPGEHLIVRNIRVQNTGGMPSPKNHAIQVLIHGTHWLEPISTEPVYLPKNIQTDEIVEVPGVLRAFIMQERVARAPGVVFSARDEVQLIATMPRINRAIPEFKGSTSIEIRYPLQLSPPKYLDCVSPGDHITFTWTLKNISRRSYGINGELRRSAGTLVKDPGQLFNFIEAEAGNAHAMVDPLEVLDPNSEVDISQTFEVSGMAMPYSSGLLTLELLISEPGTDPNRFSDLGTNILHGQHTRSSIGYPMHMQISGVYSHNPHSAFLLVVNSQTPNSAIHHIIRFVRSEMHLALDIFNLSVTGSFTDPATGRNVLQNYPGKSVIIFGNKFSYFSAGTSSAFDLLDPYLACQLATLGTNFHFAGATENLDAMRTWVSMSTFPVYAYNPHPSSPESLRAETFKELAGTLHTRGALNVQMSLPVHSIPAAPGMFSCMSTPDSALESAAQSTADKLQKQFPLRRFAVSGDTSTRTPNMPGTVVIREGFAKSNHLTASLLPYTAEDPDLADYQRYLIICCLPFHTRARMFWNMAGALDAGGILSTTIYRGKELEAMKPPITVSSTEILAVSEKLCKFISLSIEYDLGREIGTYTNDAPFMDGIPVQHSIAQLPLLNKFFDMEPPTDIVRTTERTQFIVQTLGIVQGSLLPFSFKESFGGVLAVSRKSALKKQVDLRMDDFLSRRFAPDVVAFLKAESVKEAKTMKNLVKGIPGATSTKAVCLVKLATTVQMHNARFEDLADINPSSTKWTKPIADSKVIEYTGFVSKAQNREARAREVLGNMVTKIEPGAPTSPTAPPVAHFEAISPVVEGAHEIGS